ncbi:HD-GYP domain-containing protein [Salinibius halmophilus]|uniref:HD-GYP domain-containing protein n=1 Tax=Salinibius halmophilus TaxID=1853216 RepID=UPI000E65F01A|nr:HD domain-containing phosphohydrolase [Salinibius halmophilus]
MNSQTRQQPLQLAEIVNLARATAQRYQPLSNEQLMAFIESALSKDATLLALHEENDIGLALAHHCLSHNFPPVLMQLLNQLVQSSSELAQQTAISTWLAMAIAKRAGLSTTSQHDIFTAALLKDISFNYLGYELSQEQAPNDEQWKRIRVHPLISAKLVESENYYNSTVINAIALHHERLDHSGYPRGVVGTIPMPCKIVALADQLYRLTRARDEFSYFKLMAYLRINKEELADSIINPAIAFFKQQNGDWKGPQIAKTLIESRLQVLEQATNTLRQFTSTSKRINEAFAHLQYALHQAGLYHSDLLAMASSSENPNELIELNALIVEWFWLFKRFIRVIHQQQPDHPLRSELESVNERFWLIG